MKKILFLVACLVLPTVLAAQTPTATLRWDYAAPLADVTTYTQSVSIDGTVLATAPTCTAVNATSSTCSVAAPQLATGTHTVVVAATKNGITAETRITGIGATGGPAQPSNQRLVITVTVAIGS
jgi:hypothetical protein